MILLRREAGLPRGLWTSDLVMKQFHFCNVFRCDDRVSAAVLSLSKKWQDPWRASLIGRLINRYNTILELHNLEQPAKPEEMMSFIERFRLNTNAYRLPTPLGLNQAKGVVLMYEQGQGLGPEILAKEDVPSALKAMGNSVKFLGKFLGYQVVLDLIELKAFGPSFRDDWAYPGPGCSRGAARMMGIAIQGDWEIRDAISYKAEVTQEVMSQLLAASRDSLNWNPSWRPWTIHEVEGWLCEYDKWARRKNEESAGGRKFKGPFGQNTA